jgi:uncharacterized membrane protein
MNWYLLIKWVHIISSTVLFGTGAGIAFFFVRAQRTGDTKVVARVARDVVLADLIFTSSAVALQPITGVALALLAPWMVVSIALYLIVGCCWLPVVWLQIRMRDLAIDAANHDLPLPVVYQFYYRRWFALGWPAFIGVLVIFYLMVAKPGF